MQSAIRLLNIIIAQLDLQEMQKLSTNTKFKNVKNKKKLIHWRKKLTQEKF